jgi:hypothetical protein
MPWESHGLGVYGQSGLLSLNDDCLVLITSFLPIESATSLGLTCKVLGNVILSKSNSEGLWQRIVRDLWTRRWLAQNLKDSFQQKSWKRTARVVALFMTIIGQWQKITNPRSSSLFGFFRHSGCASRAIEYIPEHDPLKPIPVSRPDIAPTGSPHWDRRKFSPEDSRSSPSSSLNMGSSPLSLSSNRIPVFSTPVASPPQDEEGSRLGEIDAGIGDLLRVVPPVIPNPPVPKGNLVPWHVTQMSLVTRFVKSQATSDFESRYETRDEFQALLLSVHLWHLLVLQCAPRMRKFIGEVRIAPLNPERTTAAMRSEMPIMYWQSMAFYLNQFGHLEPGSKMAISSVTRRSYNAGPIIGLVLPHVINAALVLLRHTHPSNIDPVRDGASELMYRISMFFPDLVNDDKTNENYDRLIAFLARIGYAIRQAQGHHAPAMIKHVTDLKLSELIPTKKFKKRLLHSISRFISRFMRHNVWNHIEDTLQINRWRHEKAWRLFQSLNEEEKAFKFVSGIYSRLPLDVTEALIVSSSYALRDKNDPSVDFGGHHHNGFAGFAEMGDDDNNENDDENNVNDHQQNGGRGENIWDDDEEEDEEDEDEDEVDEDNEEDFDDYYDDNEDEGWEDYFLGASDDEISSPRNQSNASHCHHHHHHHHHRGGGGGGFHRNAGAGAAAGGHDNNAWPTPLSPSKRASNKSNSSKNSDDDDDDDDSDKYKGRKDEKRSKNIDPDLKAFLKDFVISSATLRALHILSPLTSDEIRSESDPYEVLKAWVSSSSHRFSERVRCGIELPIFGSTDNELLKFFSRQFDLFDKSKSSSFIYKSWSDTREILLPTSLNLDDLAKLGQNVHLFLSSSDWGCGLPADKEEALDLRSLSPTFTIENMSNWSRSRFFVFTALARCIAIAPEDRSVSEKERSMRIKKVKSAKATAIEFAERKECIGIPRYSLDLEPSLTGAFYISDILPRSAAWSLSRSASIVVLGMQAYARRLISGKGATGSSEETSNAASQRSDHFHPALKRPLLSNPDTLKLWGMGQIISTQRPTEGRKLKQRGIFWDRWGIIPPKWLINDAAIVSSICYLVAAYLNILNPLSDANLINKMLSAISPLLLPDAADDVGPVFGLTDLLERLIVISSLPSLKKASRVHVLITDLINLVVYDRPQILAASGRSAELYLLGMRSIQARIEPAMREEDMLAVALYKGGIGKAIGENIDDRIARGARVNAPMPFFTSFITQSNLVHSSVGYIDVFLGSISCVLDLQIAHEHLTICDAVFKVPGPDLLTDGGVSMDLSVSSQVLSVERGLRNPSDRSFNEFIDSKTGAQTVIIGHQHSPLSPETGRAFNGTPAVDPSEQTAPRFVGLMPSPPPHPTTLSLELYSHILRWLDELEALALRYTEVFFSLLIGEWHTDVEDRRQGAVMRTDQTADRITRHVAACLLGGFRNKNDYIWDVSFPEQVTGCEAELLDRYTKATQRHSDFKTRQSNYERRFQASLRVFEASQHFVDTLTGVSEQHEPSSRTDLSSATTNIGNEKENDDETETEEEDGDEEENDDEDEDGDENDDDENDDDDDDDDDDDEDEDEDENVFTDPSYVFLPTFLSHLVDSPSSSISQSSSRDVFEVVESWKRIRAVINSLVKVGVDSNNRFEQMQPLPLNEEVDVNQENGDPLLNEVIAPLNDAAALPRGAANLALPMPRRAPLPPPPPPLMSYADLQETISELVKSWETLKKSFPENLGDLREMSNIYPFAQLASMRILSTIAKDGLKEEMLSKHTSLVVGLELCLNSISNLDMKSKELINFLNLGPPEQPMDEDAHGDPIASMDQLYQTMNLLTRICTLRSLLVKWVPPSSSSHLPSTIPVTSDSPSWGLTGTGVKHLRDMIDKEPFGGEERWSRVASIAVSLLFFADVTANPNLDEDEETEYEKTLCLNYSPPKRRRDQDSNGLSNKHEAHFEEERKRYRKITGDFDLRMPTRVIEPVQEIADVAAAAAGDVGGGEGDGDGDAEGNNPPIDSFAVDNDNLPALLLPIGRPQVERPVPEEEVFEDDWSEDMLLTQALPHLSSAGFDLLGVLVRHIPVETALAAINFVGVYTIVRLALSRINSVCSKVCLHSFFYFVAESVSGRIPLLTMRLGRQLIDGQVVDRDNWFLFIKHSMLSIPHTGTAAYIQLCVALVRILTQMCLKQNEWCVLIGNDPRTLAGFTPMLESSCNPDKAGFQAALATDIQINGESARARWNFPRRLNEKDDFQVPTFLTNRPDRQSWFEDGGKDEPDFGRSGGFQSNFDAFLHSFTGDDGEGKAPPHLAVPRDAPFLEHLISLVLSGICSPFVVKHVRNLDLSDEAWRCLLTGTARLIRIYHRSVPSSVHGDRIWQKFHAAMIRVGGIVEVVRLGWTSLIPPHILAANRVNEGDIISSSQNSSTLSEFVFPPPSRFPPPQLSLLNPPTNYARQLVQFSKELPLEGPASVASGMDAVMMRSYKIAKKFSMRQCDEIFHFKQVGSDFASKEREGVFRNNSSARSSGIKGLQDSFSALASAAISDAIELRTQEVCSITDHKSSPDSLETSWARFKPLRVLSPDTQMDSLMRTVNFANIDVDNFSKKMMKAIEEYGALSTGDFLNICDPLKTGKKSKLKRIHKDDIDEFKSSEHDGCITYQLEKCCPENAPVVTALITRALLMDCSPKLAYSITASEKEAIKNAASYLSTRIDPSHLFLNHKGSFNTRLFVTNFARAWLVVHAFATCPSPRADLPLLTSQNVSQQTYPVISNASTAVSHLFRLSVVEDSSQVHSSYPKPQPQFEDDPLGVENHIETRNAAECVQDGRRWLAYLLWTWRLAEVGEA